MFQWVQRWWQRRQHRMPGVLVHKTSRHSCPFRGAMPEGWKDDTSLQPRCVLARGPTHCKAGGYADERATLDTSFVWGCPLADGVVVVVGAGHSGADVMPPCENLGQKGASMADAEAFVGVNWGSQGKTLGRVEMSKMEVLMNADLDLAQGLDVGEGETTMERAAWRCCVRRGLRRIARELKEAGE